jgi:hypothetical protein
MGAAERLLVLVLGFGGFFRVRVSDGAWRRLVRGHTKNEGDGASSSLGPR